MQAYTSVQAYNTVPAYNTVQAYNTLQAYNQFWSKMTQKWLKFIKKWSKNDFPGSKKIPMGKSDMKKRFRALPGPQNLHFDDCLIIFHTFPKSLQIEPFLQQNT